MSGSSRGVVSYMRQHPSLLPARCPALSTTRTAVIRFQKPNPIQQTIRHVPHASVSIDRMDDSDLFPFIVSINSRQYG